MEDLLVQFLLGGAIRFLDCLPTSSGHAFERYDQYCKVSRFLDACERRGACPGPAHPAACGKCQDCDAYAAFVLEVEPALEPLRRPRFEDAVGWS